MIPLLSDLREPPVVGRYYMVPVVGHFYEHIEGRWPVLGPLHEDKAFLNFDYLHYHVDLRFLTVEQITRLKTKQFLRKPKGGLVREMTIEEIVGMKPLSEYFGRLARGRPELAKLRCRTSEWVFPYGENRKVGRLRRYYGARKPAEPLRLADGRLLCPHRKVDLSTFAPDKHGVVVCPLHGLRVQCVALRAPPPLELHQETLEL